MLRIDFIFSYWVFFWDLLYVFNLVPYNPKFAIICGFIENCLLLVCMIIFKTSLKIVTLFFTMVFLLKLIPLYFLRNCPIKLDDVYATIGLFLIYLLWLTFNNKSINDFLNHTKDMVLHNKNTLPGMVLLDKISSIVVLPKHEIYFSNL